MSNFIAVSQLFGGQNIYVIPTFQRPYSWEDTQWNDLKSDICIAASKTSAYHYFAPIHVIEITTKDDPYWTSYTDQENEDIKNLSESEFCDNFGNALNVFLVVDGQQRVTTLYSLMFNSTPTNPGHFINLSSDFKIPRVILNPKSDHQCFRHYLGLSASPLSIASSRSQERLGKLFGFLGRTTPLFSSDSPEYKFFIRKDCEVLKVILRPGAKLASFMTLNDRGKDLTILEKSKSLLMELDENYPKSTGSEPKPINIIYGEAYVSIEATQSYLNDDEFIRQVAMRLWEYRQGPVHEKTPVTIYDTLFKRIAIDELWPTGNAPIPGEYIHRDVLPVIQGIIAQHNHLVSITKNACTTPPTNLGISSYIANLGVSSFPRDAIEDYFNVLQSLKLKSKQLGFLMAVREKFNVELHDVLGSFEISNVTIKKALMNDFNALRQEVENSNCTQLKNVANQIENEIINIPDAMSKELTPLYIAELLRLIVDTAKPGTFSSAWHSTFNDHSTKQACVDRWMSYLLDYGSREGFISNIAKTTNADNQLDWVKYLLKEFEYCISGWNAHRHSSNLDIEHFFGTSWESIQAMVYPKIFPDDIHYKNSFLECIGNKLILGISLNRGINRHTPLQKSILLI